MITSCSEEISSRKYLGWCPHGGVLPHFLVYNHLSIYTVSTTIHKKSLSLYTLYYIYYI
jgi:hypothetical protein